MTGNLNFYTTYEELFARRTCVESLLVQLSFNCNLFRFIACVFSVARFFSCNLSCNFLKKVKFIFVSRWRKNDSNVFVLYSLNVFRSIFYDFLFLIIVNYV